MIQVYPLLERGLHANCKVLQHLLLREDLLEATRVCEFADFVIAVFFCILYSNGFSIDLHSLVLTTESTV